jgi:hypothetical protein
MEFRVYANQLNLKSQSKNPEYKKLFSIVVCIIRKFHLIQVIIVLK